MRPDEYRAVLKLYHAAEAVCQISGYRWSRDQIKNVQRILEEAGVQLHPLMVESWKELKASGQMTLADLTREGGAP